MINRDEILTRFEKVGHKKGTKIYGALSHILNYGSITIRDLSAYPFYSNGSNKIIQIIKEFFEANMKLGCVLTYNWDINSNTKARFKKFYIEEI